MGEHLSEVVAVVANMVEAVLATGVGDDRRAAKDHQLACAAPRGRVFASVNTGAGAVQRPFDRASVRDREEAARGGSRRSVIVDGDLGVSGRDTHARESGKELVARVCVGRGRRDFGWRSRGWRATTARTSCGCFELCAVTDTLVLDADGIYDLQDFNDRLLLGLKAQMSEAELHVMAGRLQGAKRAAAERGELRFGLPVGYVYDADGLTIIDPERGGPGRDRRRVRRVASRDWLGVWGARRVHGPAVPEARVGRRVGGRAAMGHPRATRGECRRNRVSVIERTGHACTEQESRS